MKKILSVIFIGILSMSFAGCNNNPPPQEPSYIELALNNYHYYLNFDKYLTDSGSYAGGSYRYASYQVTISGAFYGIYENCVIKYKYEDNDTIVEKNLSANGYAQFNYSVVNGNDMVVVDVSGRIYI